MEKYSRWRDTSTGIQPFLPPVPPSSGSPLAALVLNISSCIHSISRVILLSVVALAYFLLVEGVCLVLMPIPPLYRAMSSLLTAILCRLALVLMGYWWIETETVSSKRGLKGVTQISDRSPRRGDLIICNWTSYVDALYLAFRYNPTFLLPIFSPPELPTEKFGRSTGTGSAAIQTSTLPQPPCLGYIPISLVDVIRRTGQTAPNASVPPVGMYKTLREARRKEKRPVVLFPEGTTGNGRAVLRFGDGVLADEDIGGDQPGQVFVKAFKHSAPTPFAPTATCSLPQPLYHLVTSVLFTPSSFPSRSLLVRTLHPSASPSSPSFLPSEVLASAQSSSLKDGRGAWKEAIEIVLAETARIRRVRLGWVEKGELIRFWKGRGKR